MSDGQPEWTKVRRRKKGGAAREVDEELIPYYVAGMTDSTRKHDIRNCFKGFGDLGDVYMGRYKDSSRRNFAFVKFRNVGDIWELESRMQKVVCAGRLLAVNVAKFGRNRVPVFKPKHAPAVEKTTPTFTKTYAPGTGTRSYADVTSGNQREKLPPPPPPISLKQGDPSMLRFSPKVLVGEVLSLDHLASLPNFLNPNDGCLESFKYIGGLNVALTFKTEVHALDYLNNPGRWIEWFERLGPGDNSNCNNTRLAWVKIHGLPFSSWSHENFNTLLKSFGKIVIPPDELENDHDYSVVRVGILTLCKKWVNEHGC